MNLIEARAQFQLERPRFEAAGVTLHGAQSYMTPEIGRDWTLAMDDIMAMDAQPGLSTDPNGSVPGLFTAYVDPELFNVLFSPNQAAEIFDENRKGDWTTDTAMFPIVEATGEVSSYGDYSNNGRAAVNSNWPTWQSFLWQCNILYGDREVARSGVARINLVSELQKSVAIIHNKFSNLTYFYGVAGLTNYGLINDPALAASLTPALKAWGGTTWFDNGSPAATANEVYNDILAVFTSLVNANAGLVNKKSKMTLHLSPDSEVALTFANSFGVFVEDLLAKGLPNMRIVSAVQDGALSASNPQGNAGGNFMQLIVDDVDGQDTGYCAFSEKMKSFPLIRDSSSFKQKTVGGSWGSIIRYPAGFASMIGI